MKPAPILWLALALAAAPPAAFAQLAAPVPALSVGGDATLEREPDVALVSVQIVTSDDDAARSSGTNAAIYAAFKSRVATLGLAASALHTVSFNVTFVPYPPKGLPPEQRQPRYGYVSSRNVTVTVAPLDVAGKVIDAATAAGATQVGDVTYDLRDRRSVYREALSAAMADAKRNAAALAAGGDFTVVRIRNVSTGGGFVPGPRPLGVMAMRASASEAPPPPTDLGAAGPIAISAHVTVTYDIR